MTATDIIEFIKWGMLLLLGGVVGVGLARKVSTLQSKDAAAASVEVAEARVEEKVHSGQWAELGRLQKLVQQLSDDQSLLTRKMRDLEADVVVLESYFEAIILCEDCRQVNAKIIERTMQVFRKSAGPQGDLKRGAKDGHVCASTAALVGKDKYVQAATGETEKGETS